VTGAVVSGGARLTVPANLLLLGEYAILEEGGLGIAIAVERRVVVSIAPATELTIVGVAGGGSEIWTASDRGRKSLLDLVVAAAERELAAENPERRLPPLRLEVDSSAFFGPDGAKIGIGSSAAVAVATAYALLRGAGLEGERLAEGTFRSSLDAHRSHQGGRGSGYDLAASLHGGTGLFVGGRRPFFRRLSLPWLRPFVLARGPASVDTSLSIGRYVAWKLREPAAARSFIEASNGIARSFAEAKDWSEASDRLLEGARLAAELGDAIGVPARSGRFEGRIAKALGAGDELWALWSGDSASVPEESEAFEGSGKIEIAESGPIWIE